MEVLTAVNTGEDFLDIMFHFGSTGGDGEPKSLGGLLGAISGGILSMKVMKLIPI